MCLTLIRHTSNIWLHQLTHVAQFILWKSLVHDVIWTTKLLHLSLKLFLSWALLSRSTHFLRLDLPRMGRSFSRRADWSAGGAFVLVNLLSRTKPAQEQFSRVAQVSTVIYPGKTQNSIVGWTLMVGFIANASFVVSVSCYSPFFCFWFFFFLLFLSLSFLLLLLLVVFILFVVFVVLLKLLFVLRRLC